MGRVVEQKIQRFLCQSCGKSFIFKRQPNRIKWTKKFIEETIADYIQGRSSLRIIEQRKKVNLAKVWQWLQAYGSNAKSPLEIAKEFDLVNHNRWGHTLLLDAKVVKRAYSRIENKAPFRSGRKPKYSHQHWYWLLARDFKTQDIVADRLVDKDSPAEYTKLIKDVKACGFNIWVVISDDCPSIASLFQRKQIRIPIKKTRQYPSPGFPIKSKKLPRIKQGILYNIPHQLCVIHFHRNLKKLLKPRISKDIFDQLLLIELTEVIFSKTYVKAKKAFDQVFIHLASGWYLSQNQMEAINMTITKFDQLTLHLRLKEGRQQLKRSRFKRITIPFTTNPLENSISYFEARFKTIKGFKTKNSAQNILRLIMLNFRFKPLKEAKNKRHRGKSPLALSSNLNLPSNWLKFSQKPTA